MSNEAAPPPAWPELNAPERRVLGVLVEKMKTTPDVYPLSVNSLVTGSNQKSNRDPVLNLTDLDVEETLTGLQQKGLVIKVTGGRVIRWRHQLYEAWHVGKVDLAVLAELLLRGPQTEGELRARASRMEPIDDLETLRSVLRPLAERGLVVYLSPEGRRGTMLTHGVHPARELERLQVTHKAGAPEPSGEAASSTPAPARPAAPPAGDERVPVLEARLTETTAEVTALRMLVIDLQARVANLAEQVAGLKAALGV